MAKNLSKIMTDTNHRPRTRRILSGINKKKLPQHIMFKLLKIKNKEKFLKHTQKNTLCMNLEVQDL